MVWLGWFAGFYLFDGVILALLERKHNTLFTLNQGVGWCFFWPVLLFLKTQEK